MSYKFNYGEFIDFDSLKFKPIEPSTREFKVFPSGIESTRTVIGKEASPFVAGEWEEAVYFNFRITDQEMKGLADGTMTEDDILAARDKGMA